MPSGAPSAAREAAEQQHQQDQARFSAAERETMLELPQDLTSFWRDSRTTDRERKRVVRRLIEDVTVQKADHILAQIRFKGGATRTLTVPLPPPFMQSRFTPAETLAAIDQLLDTSTDAEIAVQLNARGYRTFAGLPFQATHVSQLHRAHGLKDRWTPLRMRGCERRRRSRRACTRANQQSEPVLAPDFTGANLSTFAPLRAHLPRRAPRA